MDWVIIVFRVIHIGSAMAWAGGAALFFFYLEPAIAKLGPDAAKFVDEVMTQRKLPIYFMLVSTLAVLGGAVLYVKDAGGVTLWLSSSTAVIYTIGALSGLVAWVGGNALIPSTFVRLQRTAGEASAAGGAPSADVLARLHALQERLRLIGGIDLVLIGIAILCMESARYIA